MAVIFGDIHFGNKGNQVQFNEDCLDFIDYLIENSGNERDCIFLGDWFHSRNSLNVNTLQYGTKGIRKLSKHFDNVYMILGNHDTYYRDSLEVNSVDFATDIPNVHIVDKITEVGDYTLVPWLVGDMFNDIPKIKTKYVCGHFEMPGFLLNAMTTMPDNGKISLDSFQNNVQYIFSGHFHKRQVKLSKKGYEFHYVGNAFPHNYSDANDSLRGFCVMTDKPKYHNWSKMPNYLTTSLSELLNDRSALNDKTYAKIKLDLNMQIEDANFVRETLVNLYKTREFVYQHERKEITEYEDLDDISFDTVDEIVVKSLGNIESVSFDKNRLIHIYQSL